MSMPGLDEKLMAELERTLRQAHELGEKGTPLTEDVICTIRYRLLAEIDRHANENGHAMVELLLNGLHQRMTRRPA